MQEESQKRAAAKAALAMIPEDCSVLGVGTGSTVNFFIDELYTIRHRLDACVPSSIESARRLKEKGLPVLELNVAGPVAVYVDGADEINRHLQMIKGGGGALTREKIIASASKHFICIADETKLVPRLGAFPVAVEVLPMARSFVARELLKLGGNPVYRENFQTDNGNILLDVFDLDINEPISLEETISQIPGVIECGIFARRVADLAIIAGKEGIQYLGAHI